MQPSYQSGFYAPGRGVAKHPELWRGCVGAWNPGLGNTGLVLRDWSGNQNNGTLVNGPTWGPVGGRQALNFDGVDDAVDFGNVLDSVFAGANKKFTVASWIYPRVGGGANDFVFSKVNSTAGQRQWFFRNSGGYLNFLWYGALNASSYRSYTCNTPLTVNAWQHVALLYDGTQPLGSRVAMYVDGALQSQTLTLSVGTPVQIQSATASLYYGNGFASDLSVFSFDGLLDGGRIFDRALSANEVHTLAQRPGIAYELARRKTYFIQAATSTSQFYDVLSPLIFAGTN